MNRIERRMGSFGALGFSSEEITFNPNAKKEYDFYIVDNDLYIKDLSTNKLVLIEKGKLKIISGIFDKVMKTFRFSIIDGEYSNEYVIDEKSVEINEDFKSVDDYIKWIKSK